MSAIMMVDTTVPDFVLSLKRYTRDINSKFGHSMVSGYNGRTLSHSIDGRTLKHDDNMRIYFKKFIFLASVVFLLLTI